MNTRIYAFTSAACNYLPKVRMLVETLRQHHPEIPLVLAMADRPAEPALLRSERWDEILTISDLGIPDWPRWAFTHDIVELSTAIKPFALSALLARPDCRAVLYFDPDMAVFSRLDDLLARFDRSDVLLTPHQTRPETGLEEVMDNEICSLKHGVYNLGFLGVGATPNGRAFARWWADRVYYFCRNDIPNGLFTDQRWVDLAPAFFEHVEILRSSRFNVAPWNVTTRLLSGDLERGILVDGQPLGFYHFTGFDSGAHHVMISKYGSHNPTLQALVGWYETRTRHSDEEPLSQLPWAFSRFSDGTPITKAHRLIYRARPDLQRRFPDPFATDTPGENTFAGWCRSKGAREFPDLLPHPRPNADWSSLTLPLIPSIASPGLSYPNLRRRLRAAATDRKQARQIAREIAGIVRREGLAGLVRRIRRLTRAR